MSPRFCLECKLRATCKQICEKLRKYLSKNSRKFGMGYSERQRKRKEILWDSTKIDDLAAQRAFKLKYNWNIPREIT